MSAPVMIHAVPLGRRLFFEDGLTYQCTEPAPQPGDWVVVPLRKQTLAAVVTACPVPPPEYDVKPILGPLHGAAPLTAQELDLARYLSRKYFTPLGIVLKNMTTFADLRLEETWAPGPALDTEEAFAKTMANGPFTARRVKNAAKKHGLALNDLAERQVVVSQWQLKEPPPWPGNGADEEGEPPRLSAEQLAAYERIALDMDKAHHNTFLLEGVTGSGKTEIYMALCEKAMAMGRGALMLFPEIALTTQMIGRLSRRFGPRLVHFHSRQSTMERAAGQARVAANPQSVVIGPRSALFVRPFHPGVIILDEEHDGSYKQDQDPRYLAADVATFMARQRHIPLVLGSATPSLETRYHADQGHLHHLRLLARHGGTALPQIHLIDMREAHRRGLRGAIAPELKEAITDTLKDKKQGLIFLNRRGYHTVMLCNHCGYLCECEHCSVALTVHQAPHQPPDLRCHYCGHAEPLPAQCPACLSTQLSQKGIGTQRAEEELEGMFPEAAIARVDRDTILHPHELEALFAKVNAGEIDLLVGTQMLAKGLDFADLHLVGVLDADRQMHLPDFRAMERSFQHLVQVSGRSGRRDTRGLVLIQTLIPDHPVFAAVQQHDYDAFYHYELGQRERYGYPPFTHLIKIMVIHRDQQRVVKLALGMKDQLQKLQEKFRHRGKTFQVQGPTPAPLSKLKDDYRWQLSLKATDAATVHQAASLLLKSLHPRQRPLIRVDVEPQDWL